MEYDLKHIKDGIYYLKSKSSNDLLFLHILDNLEFYSFYLDSSVAKIL